MIENFGLQSAGSAGTEIHLMTVDDFAIWQAKASDAHQGWISAQNFHAKPGKSIYFATTDGRIDFAIGILAGWPPRQRHPKQHDCQKCQWRNQYAHQGRQNRSIYRVWRENFAR